MDTYQITAPPCLHWTDAIAAHLDPARHWHIYTDGTWHPHTPPHTDHYFHTGDTHTGGGGCLVIMATDEHWARGAILVIPFTTDGLSTDQGGSSALMELLAITGACKRWTTSASQVRSSPTARALYGSWRTAMSSDATPPAPGTLSCATALEVSLPRVPSNGSTDTRNAHVQPAQAGRRISGEIT